MTTGAQLDRMIDWISERRALDRAGRAIGNVFARVVRPGMVKDVLSGTPMRHPAHPMLTDVTIGAWTGAMVLDLLGADAAATTLVGAGALSALPTAITGVNDLADITDPEARSVAVAHAAGNVTALAMFCVSYAARRTGARRTGRWLSLLGFGLATAAGFLGGDLSYRRGIGVDRTTFEPRLSGWTPVMPPDELPEGRPVKVIAEGAEVMLLRTGGKTLAIANRCTHRGGPLHKGKISEDGVVTCPWHLSAFRLADGQIVRGPATAPQRAYETRVHEGKLEIRSST